MFPGFTGPFRKSDEFGREPVDCKTSAKDPGGLTSVFQVIAGWPRHLCE